MEINVTMKSIMLPKVETAISGEPKSLELIFQKFFRGIMVQRRLSYLLKCPMADIVCRKQTYVGFYKEQRNL